MNHIFSFHRIKQLSIRYLAEHARRDLIFMCALFFTFAFLPRLVGSSDAFYAILLSIIVYIGGMRFTARIFHEIHRPTSGMHFLHIPASRLEKFTLYGVITLVCFPVICLLLFYAGTFFGNLIAPLIPSFFNYEVIDISSLLPWEQLGKLFSQYLIGHAVFFLGSFIFKTHPTTKTIVSFLGFAFAIAIIQMIIGRLFFADLDVVSISISSGKLFGLLDNLINSRILVYINYLLYGIVLLFFWLVSYLKWKEKQI